jgi:uncharacterized protein (TIGR02099 family)
LTPAGTKAWRWIAGTVATLAIGAALVVGALRLAIAHLPDLEARIAEQVRVQTGLTLSFDSLDARFGRHGPEIYFEGARVVGAERGEVLVTAEAGRVSLAPLRSLLHRRIEIGRVVLESPRIDFLIFPDRHVELAGQAGIELDPARPRREFSLERLPSGVIEVRDATLGFRDLGIEGADFQLKRVDVLLSHSRRSLSVEGRVDLPKRFGDRLEIEAAAAGDLADAASLDWTFSARARDVDFRGIVESFPWAKALPSAGRGSLRLSAEGRGRAVAAAEGGLDFAGLALPAAAGAAVYSRAAADFALTGGDRWRLELRDLDLSMDDRPWQRGSLEAVVTPVEGRVERFELRAGHLRLENLLPLVSLLPASPARERLLALSPRGVLRDVDLVASRAAQGGLPDVEGRLAFEALGISPVGRAPGFDGLAGRLAARGASGSIEVEDGAVEVAWPAEWREPQRFPSVSARGGWERMPAGLRVWADEASVDGGAGVAQGRLRLLLRPGDTPLVDLVATVRDVDVTQVRRYLPVSRLSPKSLEWLDGAFRAGRVVEGEVELTGPARGFPYRDGEGRFAARARVEGLALAYAPGWPQAEGLALDATFEGPGLAVSGASGSLASVRIASGTAELADWRESLLIVRADAEGDAGDVQRLLAGSPLGPALGETFARLDAAGRLAGEAVLVLPLKQFADRVITVRAAGRGITAALEGLPERVTGLEGELTVRNTELYAPRLTGSALGGQFVASLDTRRTTARGLTTVLTASGTLDGSRLPALLKLPPDAKLAGTTAWRASWTVPRKPPDGGSAAPSRLRLESDLAGLASDLPAPLAKSAAARKALRLEVGSGQDGSLEIEASVERDLRARLLFSRGAGGRVLDRGVLRLGGGEPTGLPATPGLRVEGRVAALSVSDLLELRSPQPGPRRLQDWLADVDLSVGRLEVLGYEFERVDGRMRPGSVGWDIELESPAAAGRVLLPYDFDGNVPLALDMARLAVGTRVRTGGGDADPRRLPPLRVDVRACTFDRYDLGHLTAELTRGPEGLRLERFKIEHAAYGAQGSGRWFTTPAGQRSALDFALDSRDARGLLVAFGFAPVVEAEEARVTASLTWPGAPDATVLGRLSGSASLRFGKGRLLSVDPGAGRVLGLMSLAHLPRRLSLDFHDVTDKGLAFDSISGDFRLASGNAYTDDLVLRGPATEIGISGRTGLGDRSYEQTAIVTGRLGASLGVAGAIAGGPAVGAAIFLFSQIFKEPLSGAVRAYYRITGPWESPTVEKIDAEELREAAGLAVAPQAATAPGAKDAPGGSP